MIGVDLRKMFASDARRGDFGALNEDGDAGMQVSSLDPPPRRISLKPNKPERLVRRPPSRGLGRGVEWVDSDCPGRCHAGSVGDAGISMMGVDVADNMPRSRSS